jgi:hypothetical protein
MSRAGRDRLKHMTARDPILEPFDALIGIWSIEATHPLVDELLHGSVTFEWLDGGGFVIQRSRIDHELFPDAISVIGATEDGGGLAIEYFDSRGVRRTFDGTLDDGVLRFSGEFPEFAQRFSATLDGESFEGQWQLARVPGDWRDDLKLAYRRQN